MADLFDGIVPFVHAARARSFRVAAEQLGVTPAAVSKAVKRLEAQLGVSLLHRTTRRVSLSDEGARFLARCQDAMAHVQAGRDELAAGLVGPRGVLRVTLSPVLGPLLLATLPRFCARYPAVAVDLRLSDRHSHLIDERVDVALRIGPLPDSTLVARPVLHPRWATVASPGYLARHGTPSDPSQLVEHACLRFRSPRGKVVDWSFVDADGRVHAHAVPGRVDIDQGGLLVEAAEAGLGLAQVFDFMAADALREGRLVEVLSGHAAPGPVVHAVVLPGQRGVPRIRAFLEFVSQALGRTEPGSLPGPAPREPATRRAGSRSRAR